MTYVEDSARGLERVLTADEKVLVLKTELNQGRYIIFSDLHKGQRDGADDFRKCERAYNAALGYYLMKGYTLFALGDVEELWECRPKNVIAAYKYNLQLEVKFHAAGTYFRFYGNHDDDWAHDGAVTRYLQPLYGSVPLTVFEAARITVTDAGQSLGTIFLIHGHQGTSFSDRHRGVSRFFVRFVWRPIQRVTGVISTTPAKDWELREKHGLAMHQWASSKSKLILIAGHTHRPVMMSRSHSGQVLDELGKAKEALAAQTPICRSPRTCGNPSGRTGVDQSGRSHTAGGARIVSEASKVLLFQYGLLLLPGWGYHGARDQRRRAQACSLAE